MAKSQSESPLLRLPPLKVRGVRGVMKEFAEGNKTMPGPGKRNIVLRRCEEMQRYGNPLN